MTRPGRASTERLGGGPEKGNFVECPFMRVKTEGDASEGGRGHRGRKMGQEGMAKAGRREKGIGLGGGGRDGDAHLRSTRGGSRLSPQRGLTSSEDQAQAWIRGGRSSRSSNSSRY